ncbi:MAG: polysaccharide biosynthesis C-terminal domain-containing protein, partial [Kiritimatiellae bacterium]|nr:polysaccharide biosynthesis C-terminal domain-containing protein [Kiritimatiellia bacterium]
GGIFALAEPIAHCLGNKWVPIIPMVRILALATLVRCIGSASGAVFDGIGKPRLSWIVIMVRLLALAVCIYPLTVWTKWSMSGTAMAVLLSCCASYPVIVYSLFRHVGVGLRDWTQVLLTPMLVGAVMMMVVIHISSLLVGWSLPFQLVSCVLLGMATYCGLVLLLHKQLRYPIDADLWLVLEKMGFCRWLKQRGKGNN